MKKLFVIILALSNIFFSYAASYSAQYWVKTYGENDLCDDNVCLAYDYVGKSIQQTSDGGCVVAGYRAFSVGPPDEDYYTDIWIVKFDNNGDISWQNTYDESKFDNADSIQQTADGGYIVAGDTHLSDGERPFLAVKLDSGGNITWQKTYGGTFYDNAYSIQQTTEGGYIIAGSTQSFGVSGDLWVLKLDNSGDISWQKTYGGSNVDCANSIQQTTDGGYIVAGHTWSFGAGYRDFWVLKLDGSGNVTWQKTYGGSDEEQAYSIYETNDGGYVVAGFTRSFGPCCNNNFWVLKLDSNGGISWQKVYGQTTTWTEYSNSAYSVLQTIDGGYIVTGFTELSSDMKNDIMVLKLDNSGDITWQKTYGGTNSDYAYSIQQTSDNEYIIAGSTGSFGAYNQAFLLLKFDSNGKIPDCDIIGEGNFAVFDTSIEGQDTSATVQLTSATITDTSFFPQNTAVEISTICEGGSSCPSKVIYGENSGEVALLRNFRDNILNQTPEGQEIIRLYYQWSPAIVNALEVNGKFREDVKEMVDGVLRLIR